MARQVGTPWKIDISGNRYGSWVVIERTSGANWRCRCDCGRVRVLQGSGLKLGLSTKCHVCLSRANTRHGMEGSKIYGTWAQMKRRCLAPTSNMYVNYGARGIKVCDRWMDFVNFYADMGDIPAGKTLGRIDNDGNYDPGNCRWETRKQQTRNRRNTAKVEWNGELIAIAQLAENHGMKNTLLRTRLRKGWELEKALTTPSRKSQEY